MRQSMVAQAACLLLLAAASPGAAQSGNYAPGTRVEASPQQMEQFWEVCTIESGPNEWDQYRADCGGYVLPVSARWIRPLSAASQAASASAAPVPALAAASTFAPPAASAPAGAPATAPAAVALGRYECWNFNSARMELNFEITGAGRYTAAADGSEGEFEFDPGSGAIRFSGYLRESMPDGFSAIYHEPNGHPTVSFRGRSGAEASFCERS